MNAYMVYSRIAGSLEGAVLAFAHTVQEARKISWWGLDMITDEWIDVAARRLDHEPWLFAQADAEKLAADIPHAIESPTACKSCEQWGMALDERGLCEACADEEAG